MRRGFVLLCLLIWPVRALCGSPVPVELYAEVDHALRPAVVLADPVAYRGRTLLLGGIVTRTVSETGRVTVELDGCRLDDSDRPLAVDPALGRIVVSGSDLDGARLQPGRLVTLVGVVAGRSEGDGGRLPRLEVRFIHPWPTAEEEAAAQNPTCSPGRYCDPLCDPWWHDPWCDPWYYGPYPRWRFGGGYYRHWH
jgi:outer membrane lipoprotein